LENVVRSLEGEVVSSDDDADNWKAVDGAAVKDTFSASNGGSQLLVEGIDEGSWTSDERCTSIADSIASSGVGGARAEVESGTVNREVFEDEFPPELISEWLVGEGTFVEARVNSANNELTTIRTAWGLVQPEGEKSVGDESLPQKVVPEWGGVVNRDGIESKSENTIRLALNECETWFRGSLSELLVGDAVWANSNDIL